MSPFLGPSLPVSPHHKLPGTRPPLSERAQLLQQASRLLHRHISVEPLLHRAESNCCWALILLGGLLCAGLRVQPYFAARGDMAPQL